MNERLDFNSTYVNGQTWLDPNSTFVNEQTWPFPNRSKEYFHTQYNTTYVGFYLHQPPVAATFIVSYLLIFLVCMLGNGVVCFIVLRSKHMRTVTNLFILNLAVSDLLVGIFCMPTTLLDNIITGKSKLYLQVMCIKWYWLLLLWIMMITWLLINCPWCYANW